MSENQQSSQQQNTSQTSKSSSNLSVSSLASVIKSPAELSSELSHSSATTPKTSPRIVFMGTPEFAVASLDALVRAGYPIVGVITAPDKPAGRGMQLTESAVKKYAREKELKILQPEKLKDPLFLEELRSLQADLQVVVAFRMLPEVVWNMPPMGTVNLHGSLLPQYRGAAPINWAVINGEKETGVTTFKLQHDIDTGNILLQDQFPIAEQDTAGEVHDRMKEIGARLLVKTIEGLAAGTLQEVPQDQLLGNLSAAASGNDAAQRPTSSGDDAAQRPTSAGDKAPSHTDAPTLKHAPKIFTGTGKIDWNKPVADIYNLIRGLSPFPAAFTHLDGKLLKIYHSEKESTTPSIQPGMYQTDQKTWLKFAAPDGYIRITELQLEGKKKMKTGDFLRGYKFASQ